MVLFLFCVQKPQFPGLGDGLSPAVYLQFLKDLSRVFGWSVYLRDDRAPFVRTLIGFIPVFVLGLIPGLNAISFLIAVSLGWGIAIEKLFNIRLGTEA